MPEDSQLKIATGTVSIVTEIIKAAGGNPKVKEAGGNLGQAAVTLTKTINNALLPLAAVNFAFDKAREYFNNKFQQDISEKAASIPPEYLIEPKASVAGPALQSLAFSHEEPNLKAMYLNLLATAMDNRVATNAHPAFVEIIKQLDSEDAQLLLDALRSEGAIPIVQIHSKLKNNVGYRVLLTHLLNLNDSETGTVVENPQLPAVIDNWLRLGLVEVAYDKHINSPGIYSWVEQRPEFIRLSESNNFNESKVEYQKGLLYRTAFGNKFAEAVGMK